MAAKKKAAKAGAGAYAAGKAVRSNQYVQRLMEDDELRDNLRNAFTSAKNAYGRINGKGPSKALDDKKTQRELKDAAASFKVATDQLRGVKKRKKRKGRLMLLALVGAGAALALSEGLRKKVLDAMFGAEEEFEYTATTTPGSGSSSSSSSSSEPVSTG
jgi:adenylosuccinate synthase